MQIRGVCRHGNMLQSCRLRSTWPSYFLLALSSDHSLQVMHHVLLAQEVVCAVLSWVDSPETALALASSSRVLAVAGLEAVWRHGDAWKLAMTIPEHYRYILDFREELQLKCLS